MSTFSSHTDWSDHRWQPPRSPSPYSVLRPRFPVPDQRPFPIFDQQHPATQLPFFSAIQPPGAHELTFLGEDWFEGFMSQNPPVPIPTRSIPSSQEIAALPESSTTALAKRKLSHEEYEPVPQKRLRADHARSPSPTAEKDKQKLSLDPTLFAREILSELEEDLTCPICAELMVATHIGNPCGHAYCGGCVWNWIKRNEHPTCPVCRAQLTPGTFVIPMFAMDHAVESHVRALATSGSTDWAPGGSHYNDWMHRKEEWQASAADRQSRRKSMTARAAASSSSSSSHSREMAGLRRSEARANQQWQQQQHTIHMLQVQVQASTHATEDLRAQLAQSQLQAQRFRGEAVDLRLQTDQLRGCEGEYQQHIQFLEKQIGFYHGQLRARDQRLAQLVIAAPAHVQQQQQQQQEYSGAGAAEPCAEGGRSRQQQQPLLVAAAAYASQQPAGVQDYRGAGLSEHRVEGHV